MLPVIYSFQLTQLIGMQSNKSADPCRQQGERVREWGTRRAGGKRKDCHGVLSLRGGPFRSCAGRKPAARGRTQVGSKKHGALTRPAQEEGQLQEQDSKLAASSAGRQAN